MRVFLWVLGIVIVAALVAAYVYRDTIGFLVMKARVTPKQAFSEANAPPAPDYSDPGAWAALPDTADGADLVLPGATTDGQAAAQADVFYVHPTNYVKNGNWNGPLDDAEAKGYVDDHYLPAQASVFNSCCRVYAPRYRAAAFAAFLDTSGSGQKAVDLAYQDVVAAFDYYRAHYNQGRPLVLAAHSQGSKHLVRLISERIKGTELAPRIVAVYAIGWPIDQRALAQTTGVPVCDAPDTTGCLLSWNSVGPRAQKWGDPSHNVCVNPLTWKTDGARAEASLNLGAMVGREIKKGVADARCVEGRLIVADLRAPELIAALAHAPMNLGREVYHVYDYNLFYMSIRANSIERVLAYVSRNSPARP
jgi:hypothetical protein